MRWLSFLLPALLGGCILQGGGHLGATMHRGQSAPRSSWGARVISRLDLDELAHVPLQLGLEIEGRAEDTRGGFLTNGLQLGTAFELSSQVGLGLHAEVGTPAGWGPSLNGSYWGATAELPIELSREYAYDVNRNYRFIEGRPAVVPQVRIRLFDMRPARDVDAARFGWELSVGFAVRSRLLTDIL